MLGLKRFIGSIFKRFSIVLLKPQIKDKLKKVSFTKTFLMANTIVKINLEISFLLVTIQI